MTAAADGASTIDALIPMKLTFSPREVCELLGLGEAAVYEALRTRSIPSLRIGRKYLVPRLALLRLLDAATDTPIFPNGDRDV